MFAKYDPLDWEWYKFRIWISPFVNDFWWLRGETFKQWEIAEISIFS